MNRIALISLMLVFASLTVTAQVTPEKKKATDADKVAVFDEHGRIARGEAIGDSQPVSLIDVLEKPSDYTGKPVTVSGYVVRSCKKEGCWAELGPEKDAKRTVRVTMKGHQFFIPLKSAGFRALAEGVFAVRTISSEMVKHLVEEDGAKFENLNPDGTVTEISFIASGIILTKE